MHTVMKEYFSDKDEDHTSDTVAPHYDKHIESDDSNTMKDNYENNIQAAAKPKKSKFRVLKNPPIDAIIGNIIGGRMLIIVKWSK